MVDLHKLNDRAVKRERVEGEMLEVGKREKEEIEGRERKGWFKGVVRGFGDRLNRGRGY